VQFERLSGVGGANAHLRDSFDKVSQVDDTQSQLLQFVAHGAAFLPVAEK